ncbi:MAG: hypothetical protein IJ661_07090 [Lachnospiraceae bacterium]|nr:hypothetical protein [Lachnospiraceae bacterium]
MKKTKDYDNTFKTLKLRHKRLFISCINEAFNKDYPLNADIEVLPSEGFIVNNLDSNEEKLEERDNDFIIRIDKDYYLIECQSYDDGDMALRIAEYSFLAARQNAVWDQGHAVMSFPHYSVIYLKSSKKTPKTTTVSYVFPDGQRVDHTENNIFLENITKEEIVEKKLFVYVPFYIIRYEKELTSEKNYEKVLKDLEFLYEAMLQWKKDREITDVELADLSSCMRVVARHITDGNDIEDKVVKAMGGEIIELPSDRLREAEEKIEKLNTVAEEAEEKIEKLNTEAKEAEEKIAKLNTAMKEAEARVEEVAARADEADARADEAVARAEEADARAEEADARADEAVARAEEANARAERYMKILIENGIKVP